MTAPLGGTSTHCIFFSVTRPYSDSTTASPATTMSRSLGVVGTTRRATGML